MITEKAYVRRERIISAAVSACLSGGIYAAVFGLREPAMVWGSGGYAFDGFVQAMAIGLMASLVPGLLCRRAVAAGHVASASPCLPGNGAIMVGSLKAAVTFALMFGGSGLLLLWMGGWTLLMPLPAVGIKLVSGAIMGLFATHRMLRRILR